MTVRIPLAGISCGTLASTSSAGVRIRLVLLEDLRTPGVHHGTASVEDIRLYWVARHQENVSLTEHNVPLDLCGATFAMPCDLKVQRMRTWGQRDETNLSDAGPIHAAELVPTFQHHPTVDRGTSQTHQQHDLAQLRPLADYVKELERDLAAARTGLRQVIRDENR